MIHGGRKLSVREQEALIRELEAVRHRPLTGIESAMLADLLDLAALRARVRKHREPARRERLMASLSLIGLAA